LLLDGFQLSSSFDRVYLLDLRTGEAKRLDDDTPVDIQRSETASFIGTAVNAVASRYSWQTRYRPLHPAVSLVRDRADDKVREEVVVLVHLCPQ